MNAPHNQIQIELGEITDSCFVVMPFNTLFKIQYEKVIRPAVEAAGLKCVRGDEIFSKPRIVDDIWRSLRQARIVVAELTGRNPNVLYEVGLAHAVGKPVLILTRNEEDVPFDLKALRYLYYDTNDPFWGENLVIALQSMIKNAIAENAFGDYLQDVSIIGKLSLSEVTPGSETVREERESGVDVSGSWSSKWRKDEAQHVGVLDIVQQKSSIKAILTVTYTTDGPPSVVRESLDGIFDGKRINLNGVNYTFLQRATDHIYALDRFDLRVSKDGTELVGKLIDEAGSCKVVFSKHQK